MEELRYKIRRIGGKQVMLDSDLAKLYQIPTKVLKQAVKRNIKRFPSDFMFKLSNLEIDSMGSQIVTPSKQQLGGYVPFVFTEQGVAMLSSVLRSEIAIQVNIKLIRAFIEQRKFLQNNANVFLRLNKNEQKLLTHDNKINQIFNLIQENNIKPKQGIFFNGQIFDAYKFISNLIKSAKSEIILIDNFVDESTLTLFSESKIKTTIYTKHITTKLKLSLKKYNQQYNNIQIKEFKDSHDRFLIIDEEVYHIGASLKDLGKKWFAFSKFIDNKLILNKLK